MILKDSVTWFAYWIFHNNTYCTCIDYNAQLHPYSIRHVLYISLKWLFGLSWYSVIMKKPIFHSRCYCRITWENKRETITKNRYWEYNSLNEMKLNLIWQKRMWYNGRYNNQKTLSWNNRSIFRLGKEHLMKKIQERYLTIQYCLYLQKMNHQEKGDWVEEDQINQVTIIILSIVTVTVSWNDPSPVINVVRLGRSNQLTDNEVTWES